MLTNRRSGIDRRRVSPDAISIDGHDRFPQVRDGVVVVVCLATALHSIGSEVVAIQLLRSNGLEWGRSSTAVDQHHQDEH